MRTVDRQRGCLYGLAIGDALGATFEFQPPGTFEPVIGYRAGGAHGLEPGEWTDDTSMALADSIADAGWNLNDQCERYLSSYRDGAHSVNRTCSDIGNTTVAALRRFERDGDVSTSLKGWNAFRPRCEQKVGMVSMPAFFRFYYVNRGVLSWWLGSIRSPFLGLPRELGVRRVMASG